MFRRYVFFTAKIWMVQMVEVEVSIYIKERTPAENRTAASSEGTAGFFHGKCCAIRKNLIIYLKGGPVYGTHRKQNNYT